MKAERLAEIRERRDDQPWLFSGMIPELKIYKRTVSIVGENGIQDTKDNSWSWDECHPTADACRAAIPVEE